MVLFGIDTQNLRSKVKLQLYNIDMCKHMSKTDAKKRLILCKIAWSYYVYIAKNTLCDIIIQTTYPYRITANCDWWGAREFSNSAFISRNSAACRSHAT